MAEITPFQPAFEVAEIDELRARLRATRWPERETVDGWDQGVPLGHAQQLATYWAEHYDFAAAQRRLDAHRHYRTTIDGIGIHFVHARSPHAAALPIVLTHGWPGSFVEFLDVVGPLTHPADPADAFHVVVPSLPGYGWSDKPASTGWGIERIVDAWDELMRRLGYERYGAQGGDWGAMVTTGLAQRFPERVAGIHLNLAIVAMESVPMDDLTDDEVAGLESIARHVKFGRAYSEQQSTRPQTLGYGLTDSPVAQLAWIAEKYWAWTDCDGDPERAVTKEQMLDNISVYWFTATATSSARLYWESLGSVNREPVDAPTGLSMFPRDMLPVSQRWAETRFRDIRWFNRLARGGHFPAVECPDVFVDEVRNFFRLVR